MSDRKFQRNAITGTYMRLYDISFKTCPFQHNVEYGFVGANVSKIIHILLQKHIVLAINCLISMEVSCSITH
jgi:hypothetical protein